MHSPAQEDLWVFGYGSLMWRPGFPFQERRRARLFGFHRSLCIYSHVHRGTPDRPGLVLGLDRGGGCAGIAYRVERHDAPSVIAYLREREQATAVYLERHLPVRLDDGRTVRSLAYVADRKHPQYAGSLSRDELLRFVRQGVGMSGPNPDYVRATHAELIALGVLDEALAWLDSRLQAADAGSDGV